MRSNDLKSTLTDKNYYYVKQLGFLRNEKEVDSGKIRDLIEAAFFFDFKELKITLMKCVGSLYWCEPTL